jgi:hypothetical protein
MRVLFKKREIVYPFLEIVTKKGYTVYYFFEDLICFKRNPTFFAKKFRFSHNDINRLM